LEDLWYDENTYKRFRWNYTSKYVETVAFSKIEKVVEKVVKDPSEKEGKTA